MESMQKITTLSDLRLRDVTALKGLAITAIVFHNCFHLVSPVHENEFDFDPNRFRVFIETILHPSMAIQALFSFFGHFGVQVFIFLSAYGIAKKYWEDRQNWTAFMWGRIRKLYPIFGVVVLGWTVAAVTFGGLLFVRRYGLELVLMFLGVSNIVPGYGLPPIGPWWFIPFIMQFYGSWPFLRMFSAKFGNKGLLVLSVLAVLLTYALNPILDHRWSINLLETPVGHTPEICLGIVAARTKINLDGKIAMLASAVLLIGSAYYPFWLFSFSAALVVSLWVYLRMRDQLNEFGIAERIGRYSLIIFLVNAVVRNQFLESAAKSPYSQLLYALITASLSFGIAVGIQKLLPPPRDGLVAVPHPSSL